MGKRVAPVDLTQADLGEPNGQIVLADTLEGNAVKRVRWTERHALLFSDNQDQAAFPPVVWGGDGVPENWRLIGTVIWAWVDLR